MNQDFYDRINDYIEKHRAKAYTNSGLYDKAIDRLCSKSFVVDGVVYIGACINWVFNAKQGRVSKQMQKEYSDFFRSVAERILFQTPAGIIGIDDVWKMIITPSTKSVRIVTTDYRLLPLCTPGDSSIKLEATDIRDVEIHLSEKMNEVLITRKDELKALPDMLIVFRHLLDSSDIEINTNREVKEQLIKKMNQLEDDDDDYTLLTSMASDLLDDLKLIYNDIVIYWG
ncbi:MAG: hypothetical protein J1E63_07700 [Muribaculaceae bacterium]|nr:hypothetical protein [Muribaculaceae bacterium]